MSSLCVIFSYRIDIRLRKYALMLNIWLAQKPRDLVSTSLSIVEYIRKDNTIAAKSVFEKIREKAQSSHFLPLRGRVVPELAKEGITIYRELIISPWRVVYKIEGGIVYIMAILDSRQNLEDLLFKKLLAEDFE